MKRPLVKYFFKRFHAFAFTPSWKHFDYIMKLLQVENLLSRNKTYFNLNYYLPHIQMHCFITELEI